MNQTAIFQNMTKGEGKTALSKSWNKLAIRKARDLAFYNTYGKDINPESVEKMKERLHDNIFTYKEILKAIGSKEIHVEELEILIKAKIEGTKEALNAAKL